MGLKKYEGRVLYDDGLIKIGVSPVSGIDHDVFIGDLEKDDFAYCYLGRGILEEFARAKKVDRIRSSLEAMQYYDFETELTKRGLNLSDFAWACAKAIIRNQEEFIYSPLSRATHRT